jgi:hypothetical protein
MRAFLARRGISYTKKEVSQILFTVFSFAVVFFIQKWRTTSFSSSTGISYFLFILVFFLILTFVMISAQKRYGYLKGYIIEYENSVGYLLIAIIITFLFQGTIIVLIPGLVVLNITKARIGHFREEVHERDIGATALMMPVTCVIISLVLLICYGITKSFLFTDLIAITMATALFTLTPTPKNNGLAIFRWSRYTFGAAILITFLIFLGAVLQQPSLLFAVLGGMVVHFAIGIFDLIPRLMYGS